MERKKKGNYFGTEIDHSWYKRFRKDGFFARGNGEFWLEDDGLYFLRKLTKTPLHIPWSEMTGASLGKWHAGRWGGRQPILKVDFRRHGLDLSAGFLLGREWPPMKRFAEDLEKRIEKI